MNMIKNAFVQFSVLIFLGGTLSYAQNSNKTYLNGFRLGITGEANVAPAMSVLPTTNSQSTLKAFPAMGGKIGIEFSYYFAKYFGVQVGLDFGSRMQYTLKEYNAFGNLRGKLQNQIGLWDFSIPVKMVFHVPVAKNVLLYSAVGMNLNNMFHRPQSGFVRHSYGGMVNNRSLYIELEEPLKFRIDFQMNAGVCYRLPYNDLIRGGIAANLAFRDNLRGLYQFQEENNTGGMLSYRHNHIGLEFAYIHCFKTKAQRMERSMKKLQ